MDEPIGPDMYARLEAQLAADLGSAWDDLDPAARADVERALVRATKLLLRGVEGDDVEEQLAVLAATLANWQWVGSSKVQAALRKVLAGAAEFAIAFLATFAKEFVKGL